MKRFIFSIFITPLLVTLIFTVIAEPIANGKLPNLKLVLEMIPIFYIFTLLGLIVFGLPIYFLLNKTNVLSLLNLVIAGAMFGVLYMVLFAFILSSNPFSIDYSMITSGSMMGALSALVFGLVAGTPLLKSKIVPL